MLKKGLFLALAFLVVGMAVAADTSKKVELQVYLLGDAPKDLPLIEAQLNKMALKDINATVKFHYIAWTGWDQKYNLLLSSGQPVDLIYAATWTNYSRYAQQGAFLPLDELLSKNAPALVSFVSPDLWKASRVEGKIFGVPGTWKEYTSSGLIYREDLRKKYNLPMPNSLANMEAYFDGIKRNEPNMFPLLLSETGTEPLMLKYKGLEWAPDALTYGQMIYQDNLRKAVDYFGSQDFVDDASLFKRWADKGFWPKSVLSQPAPDDGLEMGRYAARANGQNPGKFSGVVSATKATHPDWEWGFVTYGLYNGVIEPAHATQNLMVIPKGAKNPDRALMFYQKLVLDKNYNRLTQYGVDGKHYTITKSGHYQGLPNTGFDKEAMNGWAWRNPAYMLNEPSFDLVKDLFATYDKVATVNIQAGFADDPTNYQAELAAYNQVFTQYGLPIVYGLAGDPEVAIKTFRAKVKEAGLDRIRVEWNKQWQSYLDNQGVKK